MRMVLIFFLFAGVLQAKGVEDAATYHHNSSLQWQIAIEAIDRVAWGGSERVLDIGCGDGKITAFLAQRLGKGSILGIDISPSMIGFASSCYAEPNLEFQVQNGSEISFENVFDKVVSFSALHWVLEQEEALQGIYRALVPGGEACLQIYGEDRMKVTSTADRLIRTEKWAPYFPSYSKQRVFFTEQEYAALLEKAGFEKVQIHSSWNTVRFADRERLILFAAPLLNFTRHLPEALQREFVEEVADEIISIAGLSADGEICYRTLSLQAVAAKPKKGESNG